MRKYFLSLVAMAAMIFLSGCNKNEDFYISENGDMVTFNIATPEMGTRAFSDGSTATNLTVAVYQGGQYREALTQNVTINGSAQVSLPLVTGVTYDIVFWAYATGAPYTFNPENGIVSVNYNGVTANNENLDAFYANKLGYTVQGPKTETIKLTRPFAQLNVATLDYDLAANSGIAITQTAIEVEGVYTSFNLRNAEGAIDANTATTITLGLNNTPKAQSEVLSGYETYSWLSMNYLLVNEKTTVRAKMATNNGNVVREWFNIPVQRNYRTNILGNILTTTTDFNVVIDERFTGDVNPAEWDGSIIEPKEIDGVYHIDGAAQLAWLAAAVNGTIPTKSDFEPAQSFKGKTFELGMDIDLKGKLWTPIGNNGGKKFEGRFDGKGFTISNITVAPKDANDNAPKGLFGAASYVSNLTVKNVNISGHYKTGAIVGDGLCSRIDNCHVDGGVVISTPDANKDRGNHVGGIVGYLSAENEAYVKNSSVKNLTITAYRDVAGIAGTANGSGSNKPVVSNCLVEKTTITADQSCEYIEENKAGNAGEIVGRNNKNIDLSSNRAVDVTIVYQLQKGISLSNGTYTVSSEANKNALNTILSDINSKNPEIATIFISKDVTLEWETGAGHGSTPLLPEECRTNLTIDGQGTLKATGSGVGPIRLANSGATLTIKNITIKDESTSYAQNSWEFTYLEFGETKDEKFVFENVTFKDEIQIQDGTFEFTNCKFESNEESVYAVWVCGGIVSFENCYITGFRGIKTHEAYGSEIDRVLINNCTFEKISKKPGLAIGTLNNNTTIALTNCQFIDCENGMYETDTDITTFTFINENNVDAVVNNAAELGLAIANGKTNIVLAAGNEEGDGEYGTIIAQDGITYIGSEKAKVDCINLNGADNVTIKNITFDAATAVMGCDGNGNYKQPANIITGQKDKNPAKGANNVTIDGCVFGGTFADGGVVIAFTDQNRGSGGSGNITIKNCQFNTSGGYAEIYTYYSGNNGFFVIEKNTFSSNRIATSAAIYLGKYQSSTPVVLKNNVFEKVSTLEDAIFVQDHGTYGVSVDASNNKFAE